MAPKRVDPLKAKAAKQKKIAIVGSVLLLAVLAYQGPKTFKMLQGPPQITPPSATAPATPTATAPAIAGAPAAAASELAAVSDSDLSPEAEQGQLPTFERFSSKDPFAQQALPKPVPVPAPAPEKPAAKPQVGAGKAAGQGSSGTPSGFTTGGSTPTGSVLATATSIVVNGVAEEVKLDEPFPVAAPTFLLVSIAPDGKSVQIGIAGGVYSGGGETLKLGLGKKVTLQNTADGSRYELELLSIQGFPLPKK
jgi:hypothetical protein